MQAINLQTCGLRNFVSMSKGRVSVDVNWNSSGDSSR